MKAGIIGLGTVGRAQVRMLVQGFDLVLYDKAYGGPYPADELAACEFAVICVDTPPKRDGSADLLNFMDAIRCLPDGLPALIRSTVPPGTTDGISGRLACHAPEFIHEREGGLWRESADVPFLILGGDPAAREYFEPRLRKVYPGRIHGCDAVTAELVKYTANIHWAARVTFVNEMAGVCAALGGDWEAVREAWLQDERVGAAYTGLAGFPPGFGGRCWPKDLRAIIRAAEHAGYDPEFLRWVDHANLRFRS